MKYRDRGMRDFADSAYDIVTVTQLRAIMTRNGAGGGKYIDYLLQGDYFDGKDVWVNHDPALMKIYTRIIDENPHLEAESPYGRYFRKEAVRVIGENDIVLSPLDHAPSHARASVAAYREDVALGQARPRALMSGGPAAKIAALLLQIQPRYASDLHVVFAYDGAEQSNESASAHYEHINHANALNAEHDNSGLAILILALRRALKGEPVADVALCPDYHKVDLWPGAATWRDVPLFFYNEWHGRVQKVKYAFKRMTDHDKSRLASKISTKILSYLEKELSLSFRLPNDGTRAFFLYLSRKEHQNSFRDHEILSRFVKIYPTKVSPQAIAEAYGPGALRNVVSADVYSENQCIRHGFDRICTAALQGRGGSVAARARIRELYLSSDPRRSGSVVCAGVRLENIETGQEEILPVSYVGLSLGPTARYCFPPARTSLSRFCDWARIAQPVPYQTIATGMSAQLLFRITDLDRFATMPHTGLKQTHFVEVGRWREFLVLKLTCGGNIGLPVYSRSYALGALASLFRVLTLGCGLEFVDVICAWPGARAVNGPNNGQVVRLADNAAIRFGEGGTGMSKMASNAQTLIDLIGLEHGLPPDLALPRVLYGHTVLDRRALVGRRLGLHHMRATPAP